MTDRVETMDPTANEDLYEVSFDNINGQPKSQYETRESRVFRDQHGRRWTCRVEKKSGQPVGSWHKMDWTAPLDVPGEYMLIKATDDGSNVVEIQYPTWITTLEDAHREYEKRERQLLQARFDDEWHKYREQVPEDIRLFLGRKPDAVEPVVAAMQGNAWVLGLTTRVDLRLVKWLEPVAVETPVSKYGDFSAVVSAEDVEEDADPDALGGKTIPVRKPRTKTAGEAA